MFFFVTIFQNYKNQLYFLIMGLFVMWRAGSEAVSNGASASQTIVTNARHADALRRTLEAIQRSLDAVALSIPGDLVKEPG